MDELKEKIGICKLSVSRIRRKIKTTDNFYFLFIQI